MELLGYIAAVAILGVFLLFFHDVLVDEENPTGMGIDLPVAAIFLVAHAAVTALTSATFAFVGVVVVVVVMLHPARWAKRRIEAAGFDTTRRTLNAPLPEEAPSAASAVEDEPIDVESIEPVEVREPVTAGGGGLTPDENAVWEDLTRRLDD